MIVPDNPYDIPILSSFITEKPLSPLYAINQQAYTINRNPKKGGTQPWKKNAIQYPAQRT